MTRFRFALMAFFVCANVFGQTSLWTNSPTPRLTQVTSTASVTVGLKFSSNVAGSVTGIRFYKGSRNTGTHTGALWASTGTKLASVNFSGETASGWQQANFSSPVNIAANTTYVISYTAPYGAHAHDQYYSWGSLSSGSLRVADSAPGVYTYGSGVLFPRSAYNNSNYWVDVVFKSGTTTPTQPPPTSTYNISGKVSGASATLTLSGAASRSTSTDGSGNFSFTGLPNGSYIVAPSASGFTFSPATASVSINGASKTGVYFTASAVAIPTQHTVTLSWKASTSTNLKGYNIYRAATAGGAFTKVTASPVASTIYNDSTVASGRTYYYVTTSVNTSNAESSYSNQATAVVPYP